MAMDMAYSPPETFLLIFALLIGCYFIFLAQMCARLWYYDGALGPDHTRYIILPQKLKEFMLKDPSGSGSATPVPDGKSGPDPALERKSKQGEDQATRSALAAVVKPSRFCASALFDPNAVSDAIVQEIRDESARMELLERKHMGRIPHFVQDDCGDGRLFPNVVETDPQVGRARAWRKWERMSHMPSLAGTDTRATLNLPGPLDAIQKFRNAPPNYMTMGLRKMDPKTWLMVDSSYTRFWQARSRILEEKKTEVVQEVREAEETTEELMMEVVEFLATTYPECFEIFSDGFGVKYVRNNLVGEKLRLQRPWTYGPLEMCARLAMEDFNVLARSEFTGEHMLIASATLFPAGWRLRERIGKSITDLHGPVPLWNDLPVMLNEPSFFNRMLDGMERQSFFIQINPDDRPLSKLLFIQEGKDFFPGDLHRLNPAFIVIRRERQTFRRLAKSGSVVFTVKTTVERLVDLPIDERENLIKEIKNWPSEIATYKGRDLWEKAVFSWCQGKDAGAKDRGMDGEDRT